MRALLVLEDGAVFPCYTFTGSGEVAAEVCFNTTMTGYQEVLTDPSYKGQMVVMTYPLIGNYGVNQYDVESSKIQVSGILVKEYLDFPSNFRSERTLREYLNKYRVLGVEGLDTRALARYLRIHGSMRGVLSTEDFNQTNLIKKAQNSPSLLGNDLVKDVTCRYPYRWINGRPKYSYNLIENSTYEEIWISGEGYWRVVVLDCGVKYNILRILEAKNIKVLVLPVRDLSSDMIMALNPDGIVLSNGPGDPGAVTYLLRLVCELLGKKPIFGICLGHQIIGQALGGKIFKLKFGHRGSNHPVINLVTTKVEITSQNHSFCIDSKSVLDPEVIITHINLNDDTIEGLAHKKLPLFCVQYHPEASPGPHDSTYLFDYFIKMMETGKSINFM